MASRAPKPRFALWKGPIGSKLSIDVCFVFNWNKSNVGSKSPTLEDIKFVTTGEYIGNAMGLPLQLEAALLLCAQNSLPKK
jgi:hypothetical protein